MNDLNEATEIFVKNSDLIFSANIPSIIKTVKENN